MAPSSRTRIAFHCAWAAFGLVFCVFALNAGEEPSGPPVGESLEGPSDSGEAQAVEPELPPGVVARINGRDVMLQEYVNYLLATIGKSRLDEYVDRLLVDEEARRQGISVAPADVEKAVEDRVDRVIRSQYRGDRDLYARALERRRRSIEEEKLRLRQELYYESILTELIQRRRVVGDSEIQAEFERIHGEGGVEYVLRHLLISTRSPRPPAPDGGEAPSGTPRTPGEARAQAEEILGKIRGGMDFVEAVRKYSEDAFTRKNDGLLPRYRRSFFGDRFYEAVSALTPESPLSGVVESPRGYHLVQLVEKRWTRLEDRRDEIEKALKSASASPRERQELIRELRTAAKVEGL